MQSSPTTPPKTDTFRPTLGRNPHLPSSMSFYARADIETLVDEYAALDWMDQKRVDNLMALASSASPRRFVIEKDIRTLLHRTRFKRESQFAKFIVTLVDLELIYALPNNAFLLSPRLFPFEAEYPAPPTLDESRENLKSHTLDSQAAQDQLRLVMTPAERTAVSDMWKDYQQARALCGYPVASEVDKGRYDAAREAFKQQFLVRYRAEMKPKQALAEILDAFERELSDVDSNVGTLETPRENSEILTFPYTTESESEMEKTESHNNTPELEILTRENSNSNEETPDTENVRKSDDVRNSEEFVVVVSSLCEKGAPTAQGTTARMSRDRAVKIVENFLAQGLTLESIQTMIDRQADCLRFRRVTSTWDGMWIMSVERNWSPPAEYQAWLNEQQRQRKKERLTVPVAAPISPSEEAQRVKTNAYLASLEPDARLALQKRAALDAKDPIWAPRLRKHLETGSVESLSPPAANALTRFVTEMLHRESLI